MPLMADRVKERTSTVGTGNYALGGGVVGFQTFSSAFSQGDTVYYCCENGTDWEVGEGELLSTATGWELSRDVIHASSNGDDRVSWGSGSKNIFCTYPAVEAVTTASSASTALTTANTALTTANTASSGLASLISDLGNDSDALKGSALLGFDPLLNYPSGTVGATARRVGGTWPIEASGTVGTSNDTATVQSAVNYAATNGLVLTALSPSYFIDQITIPSGFRCDLQNAQMKRISGTSPKDMWVNADTTNGNTDIDIRNVRFDGRRQVDSLSNVNASHRFCGLRLVKCSGYLENIRADNTVNGEIQAEGTRGGIMLDRSVDIKAYRLFADGTDGSGVYVYQGKNFILGVWAYNNTKSGFSSSECDDNEFHHIHSDTSGNSGVSVNGSRMRCSYLYGTNAPVGYAGVNIGHDSAGNRADFSQIDNVTAENNDGWGITVVGSSNVTGSNWVSRANAVINVFIDESPNLRISQMTSVDAVVQDVRIEGSGEHWLDGYFAGGAFNGIVLITSGATLHIGESTILTGYGSGGGTAGAINASAGSTIICRGRILSNSRYGAISNGAGALVDLRGAYLDNNTAGDTLSASGGAFRYELTRFSSDPMSGSFTIVAGTSSLVVSNGNSIDATRIVIFPGDSAARTAGQAVVTALSPGVSFTATLAGNAAANAVYRYVMV